MARTRDLPPRRGRSPAPKATGKPARRRYTDADRTAALATYQAQGLAAAHRQHGIPKGTLTGWARAAGVDTDAATARSAEQTRAAAAASVAARRAALETARGNALVKLAAVVDRSLDASLALLNGGNTPDGRKHPALVAGAKPSDLVGMWTRGIHDMQLLDGKATDTSAGKVEVVFTAPRPPRRAIG